MCLCDVIIVTDVAFASLYKLCLRNAWGREMEGGRRRRGRSRVEGFTGRKEKRGKEARGSFPPISFTPLSSVCMCFTGL